MTEIAVAGAGLMDHICGIAPHIPVLGIMAKADFARLPLMRQGA